MIGRICSLLRIKAPIHESVGLLFASGTVLPTSGSTGYQKACVFQLTSSGGGFYVNEGDETSASFGGVSAVASTGNEVEGLNTVLLDEVVTLTNAVSDNLSSAIPAGAVILSIEANLDTLVVGDATGDNGLVKVGIGITANPDKYGITGSLVLNQKTGAIPTPAILASAEQIAVFAVDTAGAAVTEKFVAGGKVRVRVTYNLSSNLDDA